jgi:hypothetical protein
MISRLEIIFLFLLFGIIIAIVLFIPVFVLSTGLQTGTFPLLYDHILIIARYIEVVLFFIFFNTMKLKYYNLNIFISLLWKYCIYLKHIKFKRNNYAKY